MCPRKWNSREAYQSPDHYTTVPDIFNSTKNTTFTNTETDKTSMANSVQTAIINKLKQMVNINDRAPYITQLTMIPIL